MKFPYDREPVIGNDFPDVSKARFRCDIRRLIRPSHTSAIPPDIYIKVSQCLCFTLGFVSEENTVLYTNTLPMVFFSKSNYNNYIPGMVIALYVLRGDILCVNFLSFSFYVPPCRRGSGRSFMEDITAVDNGLRPSTIVFRASMIGDTPPATMLYSSIRM